jgi:hypothetical protein
MYWMHQARRGLVLQTPPLSGQTTEGCRCAHRRVPTRLGSSVAALVALHGVFDPSV